LGFPEEIGIGPLLYRSFTYLSTYPSSIHEENLLTYDGLVKAIAIYCDKIHDVILEDRVKLIFESFAIHEEHSALGITTKPGLSYGPGVVVEKPPPLPRRSFDTDNTNGEVPDVEKTEAETLRIESIDLDDDDAFLKALGFQQNENDKTYIVSKVLCTDMIKILTGLAWLMISEMTPNSLNSCKAFTKEEFESLKNIKRLHKVVTPIVEQMARYDASLRNLSFSEIFSSSQVYIKWTIFKDFKQRNAPNIFKEFIPFFYGQFLIGQTLSQHRQQSIMMGPHIQLLPKLDEMSEILHPINLALLSWKLPEKVLKRKEWNFLYSGSKHGFSMNRFSSHIFKYTGPTLMLINAEVITNNQDSKKENLLIGAYIEDQWRSTSSPRKCFGSEECFLFELYPTFESFPSSRRNKNYIYYNPNHGIGFGGIATSGLTSSKLESMDNNSFVIQLDNTLQYGRYRNDVLRNLEPTYSPSVTRTFFDVSFEVLEIEVFGMGGEEAKEKQKRGWKWEEQEVGRRTTSRKDSLNGVDKEILKVSIN